MPETPSSQQKLAAPAILPRRVLRVRGTSVTLIEEVRARAAQDLGVDVVFEVLDFPTCQHSAATDPDGYDIYEQCFHNLDIVWFWGALQPIQIERIGDWDRISSLAKLGGISKFAPQGFGDAPVRKLYVQPGGFLGPEPGQTISMLPTTYHMDSFGYDPRIFGAADCLSDLGGRNDGDLVDRNLRFFTQAILIRRRDVDTNLVGVVA